MDIFNGGRLQAPAGCLSEIDKWYFYRTACDQLAGFAGKILFELKFRSTRDNVLFKKIKQIPIALTFSVK